MTNSRSWIVLIVVLVSIGGYALASRHHKHVVHQKCTSIKGPIGIAYSRCIFKEKQ